MWVIERIFDTRPYKRYSHPECRDRGGLGCLRVQKRSDADQDKTLVLLPIAAGMLTH